MKRKYLVVAAALMGLSAGATSAATFNHVSTVLGGECKGFANFDSCSYNGASTIARFKYDLGVAKGSKFNSSVFPSLDGTELGVTLFTNGSGTWDYSPTGADPIITAFTVKSGKKFSIFEWDANTGTDFSTILWDTSTLNFRNAQNEKPLKKIMFFGVTPVQAEALAVAAVPLPATGLLLIAGLGGLAGLRRRRKS